MSSRTMNVAARLSIPPLPLSVLRRSSCVSQEARERRKLVLRWMDDDSTEQREIMWRNGDSYRGMPLTELLKVMEYSGFSTVASFRAGTSDLYVFGEETTGVFATADILRGRLNSLTVQFRTREKGVCGKYDWSIGLRPRGYLHGIVDGTHGFRIKLFNNVLPRKPIPRWSNLDDTGQQLSVTWITIRGDTDEPMAWMRRGGYMRYLASGGDHLSGPEPVTTGESGSAAEDMAFRFSAAPSADLLTLLEDANAVVALQRERLDALPPKWRDIADLDFQRRCDDEAFA